jgi:hypothetical protein
MCLYATVEEIYLICVEYTVAMLELVAVLFNAAVMIQGIRDIGEAVAIYIQGTRQSLEETCGIQREL